MPKRVWKDRIVERPRTYHVQHNPDGTITLIPAPGVVIEEGTPVNANNLNGLEEDLDNHINKQATENDYGHIRLSDIPKPYITDSATGENWQWKMENGIVFLEKVVE